MRIYVAGHNGMVGRAVVRELRAEGAHVMGVGRQDLDLRDSRATSEWMKELKPDVVIDAAARVGGIGANQLYPAWFIRDNLAISTNLIHAAWEAGVGRLLFLGSSCIYPRMAPQPIRENSLLSGPLEPTNEPYAVAKIAGVKMCEAYRKQYGVVYSSVMPTNLYGPGDNYDPVSSHVIPGMMRRFHEAKARGDDAVKLWGTGMAKREFLHVQDLARAIVEVVKWEDPPSVVNIGSDDEIRIAVLASLIGRVVGWNGRIDWDGGNDGTPRKRLDSSLIRGRGWRPLVKLEDGLKEAYAEFQQVAKEEDE